jgi:hypothetical protein
MKTTELALIRVWFKTGSQLRVADIDARTASPRHPTLPRRGPARSSLPAPGATRKMSIYYICKMLRFATFFRVFGIFENQAFYANHEFTESCGVLSECVHFSIFYVTV